RTLGLTSPSIARPATASSLLMASIRCKSAAPRVSFVRHLGIERAARRRATARHQRDGLSRADHPTRVARDPQEVRYARSMASSKAERTVVRSAGRDVPITNPGKVFFPEAGITKLDVVRYYLAVAEGALRGAGGRPNVLVRYA